MAKVFWSILSKVRNSNSFERLKFKQTGGICQIARNYGVGNYGRVQANQGDGRGSVRDSSNEEK